MNLLPANCTISACMFSYFDNLTPYIFQVYPSTVVGNQRIQVDGYHRITYIGDSRSASAGDLDYLLVDNAACSTLDIPQDYISGQASIYCNTFVNQ